MIRIVVTAWVIRELCGCRIKQLKDLVKYVGGGGRVLNIIIASTC